MRPVCQRKETLGETSTKDRGFVVKKKGGKHTKSSWSFHGWEDVGKNRKSTPTRNWGRFCIGRDVGRLRKEAVLGIAWGGGGTSEEVFKEATTPKDPALRTRRN